MDNKLNILIERSGITVQRVADKAGISRSYLNQLKDGKNGKRLNSDIIERLAKALDCDPLAIFSEEAPQVPVVGCVGAGDVVFIIPDNSVIEYVDMPPMMRHGKTLVAVRVKGDSMKPYIPEGSLLFYENENPQFFDGFLGKMCIVITEDGKAYVKVLERKDKKINLISANAPTIENVKIKTCNVVLHIMIGMN